MLVDRYLLYSVVSIAVVYLLVIMFSEGKIRRIIGIISLPLSLFFCLHSYYKAIPQVLFYERSHEADIYDLKHHRTTNNKMFGFSPQSLALFEESLRKNIYQFPKSRFDTLENILAKPIDNQSFKKINLNFSFIDKVNDVYGGVKISYFNNPDFYLSEKDLDNTFFIVLKNEQTGEAFLIYPQRPSPLRKDFLKTRQLFSPGFTAMIQQDCVKRGYYRIGLLVFENDKADLRYTQQYTRIENTKMIDWMQSFGYY
jgi:hypothetical protein